MLLLPQCCSVTSEGQVLIMDAWMQSIPPNYLNKDIALIATAKVNIKSLKFPTQCKLRWNTTVLNKKANYNHQPLEDNNSTPVCHHQTSLQLLYPSSSLTHWQNLILPLPLIHINVNSTNWLSFLQ